MIDVLADNLTHCSEDLISKLASHNQSLEFQKGEIPLLPLVFARALSKPSKLNTIFSLKLMDWCFKTLTDHSFLAIEEASEVLQRCAFQNANSAVPESLLSFCVNGNQPSISLTLESFIAIESVDKLFRNLAPQSEKLFQERLFRESSSFSFGLFCYLINSMVKHNFSDISRFSHFLLSMSSPTGLWRERKRNTKTQTQTQI